MTTIQDRIEKLVKDIMQCGFDVAMGGDVFKSEEENKKIQEEKYNECVSVFSHKILSSIKEIQEETRKEIFDNLPKVIEPPEDIEKFKEKRQAFLAGQINMLMRLNDLSLSITNKEKQNV